MEELREVLEQLNWEELVQVIISNSKNPQEASKVKIRPVKIKEQLLFQETVQKGAQVFHQNFTEKELQERIISYMSDLFKQCEIKTMTNQVTVLVSKKGKATIKRKVLKGEQVPVAVEASHNRQKQYILQEGAPVDFLIGLGVQTPDGKITKNRYDKFRQINRYLEFIEDVLEELPKDRRIRIIDFGCGKSYLTFAMYYYLHVMEKRDILVTGLDLKTDVIKHCNELAERLGYDQLHFEQGDISTYEGADKVDMVVSLHACDTATDYAIEKAIKWQAEVIMAVPCCQHEVNKQISCDALKPVLKYGLLKERMSAIITDAVRAELMERNGYDTQIVEFINMEHTPKNLLIRGVKSHKMKTKNTGKQLQDLEEFLHISPTLERLLDVTKDEK